VSGAARLPEALRGTVRPARWPWLAGLGVRLVIALAGAALLAIPPQHDPVWTALTVIGVLVALGSPRQAGAGLALGAAIVSWFAAYGWDASPPLADTVPFALALYLLHTSTALAAAAPLRVRLRAEVLRRWLWRCLVELAVAAVLGAASYGVVGLARPNSSSVLLLLGLAGALLLVGVPVLLLHRSRD
jgi:hypothetical protein